MGCGSSLVPSTGRPVTTSPKVGGLLAKSMPSCLGCCYSLNKGCLPLVEIAWMVDPARWNEAVGTRASELDRLEKSQVFLR